MPEKHDLNTSAPSNEMMFDVQKVLSLLAFLVAQNILFFLPFSPLLFGVQLLIWLSFALVCLRHHKTVLLALGSLPVMGFLMMQLVWRGSTTTHMITFAAMTVLNVLTVHTLLIKQGFVHSLLEVIWSPFLLQRDYFLAAMHALGVLARFSWLKRLPFFTRTNASSQLRSLATGLLLGLPLVYVLLAMFASADPIFAKFLQQFGSLQFLKDVGPRSFWTLVFFGLGVPMLFLTREKPFRSPLQDFRNWSLVQEMTVVMTLIALTLGLFLVVQWPYVFVHIEKETSLSTFGVATYSEYVKRGFDELFRAAVLIFGVIWIGLITWKKRAKEQRPYLIGVQLIVLAEFGVFLISLFRRVWLYQSLHGWTLAKIYGAWLLLGLAGMVLTLAARHIRAMKWARVEVVWLLAWLLLGSWFNAENFIVQSGHLPTVNERKDYVYLSRMSSDGVHGWILSYEWAKEVLDRQMTKQSGEYGAADRQQIAYAARVVRELSQANLELARKQASTAELKALYQLSTDVKVLELKAKQEKLSALQLMIQDRQDKMKGTTPELNDMKSTLQYELTNISRDLDEAQKTRQALQASPIDWKEVAHARTVMEQQLFFDPISLENTCTQLGGGGGCTRMSTTFFELERRRDISRELDARDEFLTRVFRMNRSEQRAYELMQSRVPHQELLRLQAVYFELRARILLQPQEQRSYEQDVSYNSPLIW